MSIHIMVSIGGHLSCLGITPAVEISDWKNYHPILILPGKITLPSSRGGGTDGTGSRDALKVF